MAHPADTALSHYISMVHDLPQLTREREQELAQRWYRNGDRQAKDDLVAAHLRYVVAIALKYRRYGLPVADLIAEGNFGVVHALKKFDPDRGIRFVTYAAYWIRAYILNHIIRSWSLVGVGSGALRSKMFFKLRRERVKIANLVGEGQHADELLAERLKLPAEKVRGMLQRLESRDVSLDAKLYDDSGATLLDTLAAKDASQESVLLDTRRGEQLQSLVASAVKQLDRRERFIVSRRLMADSEDALSLAEIGRQLGVSRERARQLEARAKKKLRSTLLEHGRSAGTDLPELDTAA